MRQIIKSGAFWMLILTLVVAANVLIYSAATHASQGGFDRPDFCIIGENCPGDVVTDVPEPSFGFIAIAGLLLVGIGARKRKAV